MKISIGVNPNCSEATLRINLAGQDKKKIRALVKKLEFELDYENQKPQEKGDWDDEKAKIKAEFELSEGYVTTKSIFGTEVIEVHGDAPYNFSDEIMTIVKRYLPDAETEWSES